VAATIYIDFGNLKSKAVALIRDGVEFTSNATGLVVNDVLVEGRARTKKYDLLEALQVSMGVSILQLDIEKIQNRIRELDWIENARIERRLPDTLFLSITEREPTALWQKEGRLSLIDRYGTIILDGKRHNLEQFRHLPVVIGDKAPFIAGAFLAVLSSEPKLFARVKSITLVSGRRWNVRLDNHIDIQLPEKNPAKAWAHLAKVERGHNILKKDVVAVDMRLQDQFIIRLIPTSEPRSKKPGRST
tara:strand:- start:2108 stop:2845 length:738 start_codon:yes stop_codon:yes gene_type:complete